MKPFNIASFAFFLIGLFFCDARPVRGLLLKPDHENPSASQKTLGFSGTGEYEKLSSLHKASGSPRVDQNHPQKGAFFNQASIQDLLLPASNPSFSHKSETTVPGFSIFSIFSKDREHSFKPMGARQSDDPENNSLYQRKPWLAKNVLEPLNKPMLVSIAGIWSPKNALLRMGWQVSAQTFSLLECLLSLVHNLV